MENYAQIEELLSDAEMKGRRWVFDRAQSGDHDGSTPTDHDILDLHRVMFSEFLDWAGTTRRDDRGPGGRVPVPWPDVRIQLRNLSLDGYRESSLLRPSATLPAHGARVRSMQRARTALAGVAASVTSRDIQFICNHRTEPERR